MITRRLFMGGSAALAATPALGAICEPVLSGLRTIPRLVGDGLHDDGPALQAMFDGRFWIDGTGEVSELKYGPNAFGVEADVSLTRSCRLVVTEPLRIGGGNGWK